MSTSHARRSRFLTWRFWLAGAVVVGAMGASFVVGAFAHKYRAQIIGRLNAMQSGGILTTNLYNIAVQKVRVPGEGRYGSVAALADGVLLASRNGALWFIDAARTVQPIATRIPVNVDEFLGDPQNEGVISTDNFGVKDVLVREVDGRLQLLTSFNQWYPEGDCYALRVALLETTVEALRTGPADTVGWRTVYETVPCYPLSRMADGTRPHPTLGAGGRLAWRSDSELLLTVGGFKSEGIEQGGPELYWDRENSYGKTILIDLSAGTSRIFTIGHRNPQGLAVADDSTIWLTEHAARGGDELNRLVEGSNYGYPAVSYGTAYDAMTWPTNPRQGRHDGFAKPVYAWVPSIGISEVIVLRRDGFPDWKGDLLVASMAMEQLYHVRIEEGRAVFVEPMRIDHRIRDLAEAVDGSIVMKTDDDFLIYLTRVGADSASLAALSPVERGQVLATGCLGCHSLAAGGPSAIGPNLHGVVGRDVGSLEGYSYSPALRAIRGRWTPDALRQFLSAPATYAPGTTMSLVTPLDDAKVDDIIAYLQTLR